MKDSQRELSFVGPLFKYIKANNERFSTFSVITCFSYKYIKANNERFSTDGVHEALGN